MNEVCSGPGGMLDPKCLEVIEHCSEISAYVVLSRMSEIVSNAASNVFWSGIGFFHLYTLDKVVKIFHRSDFSYFLIQTNASFFNKISRAASQWLSKDFLASSLILGASNLLYLGNGSYNASIQNKKITDIFFSSFAIAQYLFLLFGLFKQERNILPISFFLGGASSIYLIEEAVRNAFAYLTQSES